VSGQERCAFNKGRNLCYVGPNIIIQNDLYSFYFCRVDISPEFKVIMENANEIRIVNTLYFCEESNALFLEEIRTEEFFVSEPAIIDKVGRL